MKIEEIEIDILKKIRKLLIESNPCILNNENSCFYLEARYFTKKNNIHEVIEPAKLENLINSRNVMTKTISMVHDQQQYKSNS